MEDRDSEDHPRNAAAIRTALMLGAVFRYQEHTERWFVEGIDMHSVTKTMPAWLFIASHGICITKDGRAVKCSEIHYEDLT